MQMPNGVALDVRLTPRSARDGLEGVERRADGRPVHKARVRAAPVEGQANEALQQLLANALGIAPRQIEFAAGATARIKRLLIAGDVRALETTLQRFTEDGAKAPKKVTT